MREIFKRSRKLFSRARSETKPQTDQAVHSAVWEFPTVPGRAHFRIALSSIPATGDGGPFGAVHYFNIDIGGMRHPYLTAYYPTSGDEMKNPALLPAQAVAQSEIARHLAQEINADPKLARALTAGDLVFRSIPMGEGSLGVLEFMAREHHSGWRDRRPVEYGKVEQLFEKTRVAIDGLKSEIENHIRIYAGLQPANDPDPIVRLEFEESVERAAFGNRAGRREVHSNRLAHS